MWPNPTKWKGGFLGLLEGFIMVKREASEEKHSFPLSAILCRYRGQNAMPIFLLRKLISRGMSQPIKGGSVGRTQRNWTRTTKLSQFESLPSRVLIPWVKKFSTFKPLWSGFNTICRQKCSYFRELSILFVPVCVVLFYSRPLL